MRRRRNTTHDTPNSPNPSTPEKKLSRDEKWRHKVDAATGEIDRPASSKKFNETDVVDSKMLAASLPLLRRLNRSQAKPEKTSNSEQPAGDAFCKTRTTNPQKTVEGQSDHEK